MPDFMDAKLLPCPFCGSPAEFEYTPWNEESQTGDDGTGWIECSGCHIQMPLCSRDDAENEWNKRASGWLPIETAPKDGTVIDLWVSFNGKGERRANCQWMNGRWIELALYEELPVCNDGWKATHWMPIPGGPDVEGIG